jgi:hypothetical protein
MTVSQWVFVGGLAVVLIAVAVIAAVSWPNRRDPKAALGLAFAVIAVVSSINLTIIGHKQRVSLEQIKAELDRQTSCDDLILAVLRTHDQAFAESISRGTPLPVLPAIPNC